MRTSKDNTCRTCGKPHDELAVAIPVTLPTQAAMIAPAKRRKRVWDNGEMCAVDDAHFYIYGSVSLAIHDHPGEFTWGAWAQVDKDLFLWFDEHLETEGRERDGPFRGTLGTDIPFYDCTLGMPLTIRIEPVGYRPTFVLDGVDHDLARDQSLGVTAERVQAFKAWFDALRAER